MKEKIMEMVRTLTEEEAKIIVAFAQGVVFREANNSLHPDRKASPASNLIYTRSNPRTETIKF
jgi:hypothetical protein